jgi:hypothetical protein
MIVAALAVFQACILVVLVIGKLFYHCVWKYSRHEVWMFWVHACILQTACYFVFLKQIEYYNGLKWADRKRTEWDIKASCLLCMWSIGCNVSMMNKYSELCFIFIVPCIVIFYGITNRCNNVQWNLFLCKSTLHVSGGTHAHHQEYNFNCINIKY